MFSLPYWCDYWFIYQLILFPDRKTTAQRCASSDLEYCFGQEYSISIFLPTGVAGLVLFCIPLCHISFTVFYLDNII